MRIRTHFHGTVSNLAVDAGVGDYGMAMLGFAAGGGISETVSGRVAVFRMSRDDAQLESWFWDPVNFLWVGALDNADGENFGAELDLDYRISERINERYVQLDEPRIVGRSVRHTF